MKKIVLMAVLVILTIVFSLAVLFVQEPNPSRLNLAHRLTVMSIGRTWDKKIKEPPKDKLSLADYNSLVKALNPLERNLFERIIAISPAKLGCKASFTSIKAPENMVRISPVILHTKEGTIETNICYYPKAALEEYQRMMAAMKKDLGKKLFIDSGYRSAGIQVYLFFYYLAKENNFSLKENIRWIAMPGYSEHNDPDSTALDLINQEGVNGQERGQKAEDFEKLPEYQWLLKNAGRFHFYPSYPRNNLYRSAFEPWHWRYNFYVVECPLFTLL